MLSAGCGWPSQSDVSEEAWALHRESLVVDLHIDTLLWQRLFGYDAGEPHENRLPLKPFGFHFDLDRAHQGGLDAAVMGLVIIAPLVLRPDALAVLDTYGWDLSPGFSKRFLPLQLASGAGLFLAVFLHRQWGTGWLPLAGVVLAWAVDDLLLAFALYFALCHSREAFFEEFVERQSVARDFKALYVRSLPLTAVFTAMAGAVLWALSAGLIGERSALSFLLAGTLPHIAVLEGWVTARLR